MSEEQYQVTVVFGRTVKVDAESESKAREKAKSNIFREDCNGPFIEEIVGPDGTFDHSVKNLSEVSNRTPTEDGE